MKVLLVQTDLYNSIGGGQTAYRTVIESSPRTDFYYFTLRESANVPRPPNAHPITLKIRSDVRLRMPPPHPPYLPTALAQADQVARSVAGHQFDIVDIPDFLTFGGLLKQSFAYHKVKVGRIVLAMHGNISDSKAHNWNCDKEGVVDLRRLERAQFDAADSIYAISKRYIRAWQAIINRPVHYIDPAHFVPLRPTTKVWLGNGVKPLLCCIGRSERRKGNDLFVELVRWLNPRSFSKAIHIGDVDYSANSGSSADALAEMARKREANVEYVPGCDRASLFKLFSSPIIAILPVRYDTFNLVALESLFSGSPLVISTSAGVCDYLDEMHPNLSYTKLDLKNFYAGVPLIRDLVENYDERRTALHEQLARHAPRPTTKLNIGQIYEETLATPKRVPSWEHAIDICPMEQPRKTHGNGEKRFNGKSNGHEPLYEVSKVTLRRRVVHLGRRIAPEYLRRRLRLILLAPWRSTIYRIISSGRLGDVKSIRAALGSFGLGNRLKAVSGAAETSEESLGSKLRTLYQCGSGPIYRCNFWLDIARIERLRGNDLMAVAYELRALRLMGRAPPGVLPRVTDALKRRGFLREAATAEAMYSDADQSEQRVYDILRESYERHRGYQTKPLATLDDRRRGETAKVAVIVSLYNAADKLELFLDALSQQTLLRAGKVELILVDSNSPSDERAVLDKYLMKQPLNVVYARSRDRETIQAAWNRGIALACAPYLVFLGVDETIYPEALELLASELDQHQNVDWVMANSLVTEVNAAGLLRNDVMTYNRRGAIKDHVYLETCYLSWVGGMYRRSLHERFGYYDEAFTAAGDTEFKNRILPHINVKFVDRMLGLFLNYPDGQTTASPKAEIEDLRAWYLHRTPGGIRYAFAERPVEDAEALLRLTLGYRKSFCGHLSSDIEYGYYLASYIKERKPDSELANAVFDDLAQMLEKLRSLEFIERSPSRIEGFSAIVGTWLAFRRIEKRHRAALPGASPHYRVLNDNRHEQHSWLWRSA